MATPGNSHHNDVEKSDSVGTAAGLGRSRRRRESCLQNDSYHNVMQEYYAVFSLPKFSPRLLGGGTYKEKRLSSDLLYGTLLTIG